MAGTGARLTSTRPTRTILFSRRALPAQCETYIRLLEEVNQRISTWIPDSELSRLNRHPIGVPFPLAPPLCRLFSELFRWNLETGSAFDHSIGTLGTSDRNR